MTEQTSRSAALFRRKRTRPTVDDAQPTTLVASEDNNNITNTKQYSTSNATNTAENEHNDANNNVNNDTDVDSLAVQPPRVRRRCQGNNDSTSTQTTTEIDDHINNDTIGLKHNHSTNTDEHHAIDDITSKKVVEKNEDDDDDDEPNAAIIAARIRRQRAIASSRNIVSRTKATTKDTQLPAANVDNNNDSDYDDDDKSNKSDVIVEQGSHIRHGTAALFSRSTVEKSASRTTDSRSKSSDVERETTKTDSGETIYRGLASYKEYVNARDATPTQNSAGRSLRAGPLKAPSHVRVTTHVDYQQDVCKDYMKTGFCGYGDSCLYVHDRGPAKAVTWDSGRAQAEEQRRTLANRARRLVAPVPRPPQRR